MSIRKALLKLREKVAAETNLSGCRYFDGDKCCVVGLVAREVGFTKHSFPYLSMGVAGLPLDTREKLETFGLPLKYLRALQLTNDGHRPESRREAVLKCIDELLEGETTDEGTVAGAETGGA